jgi:hypothetical protein
LKKVLAHVDSKELVQEGIKSNTPSTVKNAQWIDKYEALEMLPDVKKMNIPSILKTPNLELKQLHLTRSMHF